MSYYILNNRFEYDKRSGHFLTEFIEPNNNNNKLIPKFDFGVGEIEINDAPQIINSVFNSVISKSNFANIITQYNGAHHIREDSEFWKNNLEKCLGTSSKTKYPVTFFDGCQDAISHSLAYFASQNGGSESISAAPSYPYWLNISSQKLTPVIIDSHSLKHYIQFLERAVSIATSSIIITFPCSLIDDAISIEDINQINKLAEKFNFGIIVDITYRSFAKSGECEILSSMSVERTIFVDSFSKMLGLPGLRLGMAYSGSEKTNIQLRYLKSCQSLLTSAFKVKIATELMLSEFSCLISEEINHRKKQAISIIEKFPENNLKILNKNSGGLYVTCKLSSVFKKRYYKDPNLKEYLLKEHLVKIMGDGDINPVPHEYRNTQSICIRLACGKTDNIEDGITQLLNGLHNYTKI